MREEVPIWKRPRDLAVAFAAVARKGGWQVGCLDGDGGLRRPALHLPGPENAPRLYLSAGIHGDEPAGPMAVLRMLETEGFFQGLEVFAFPLLNPEGLGIGTRENVRGVDLNRNYGPSLAHDRDTSPHLAVLATLPRVDVAVCLHEDWEAKGVYLYHVDCGLGGLDGRRVLRAMAGSLPVDMSELIDEMEAMNGVISRREAEFDREDWPEAIFLLRKLTNECFTLETPSGVPLEKRVQAHCAAVAEIIRQIRKA